MALVKAFRIDGIRFWFWPNDHLPPHFHAEDAGEWEIKVTIETATFEYKYLVRRIPSKTWKRIERMTNQYKNELLAEFAKAVKTDA